MSDDLRVFDREAAGQLGLQGAGDHQPRTPFADRLGTLVVAQMGERRGHHLTEGGVDG